MTTSSQASLWRRLLTVPPAHLRFAARAWVGAPVVEASLAVLGLRRTLGWIEALPSSRSTRPASIGVDTGGRLVRGVYRRHLVRGRCLPQSVLQYLLHRRDGDDVRLVLGVRPGERTASPKIEAHAWVEAAGRPQDPGFAALERSRGA